MPRKNLFTALSALFSRGPMPDSPHAGEVLTRNAEKLMRLHGVMSVGLGRTPDGRPAIMLGLENPLAIPTDLPDDVEGVPVIHTEVGRPEIQ